MLRMPLFGEKLKSRELHDSSHLANNSNEAGAQALRKTRTLDA